MKTDKAVVDEKTLACRRFLMLHAIRCDGFR